MGGSSADDAAEGDDAVGFFFFEKDLGDDGDFVSARDTDEVDAGLGREFLDFVGGVFDEGVGVFLVKL